MPDSHFLKAILKPPIKKTLSRLVYSLVLSFTLSLPYNAYAQSYPNYDWFLEIDEPPLKVWTSAISGSDFKAFKGQTQVNAPLNQVMSFIKDTPNMINWYHNTIEARRLKKLANDTWLSYSVTQAPWPVTDRDLVSIVKQIKKANSYRLVISAAADLYPQQPDRIRIRKLQGLWLIEPINNTQTRVTLQVQAEPAGEIPSWLANSIVIDMPYYSLQALKQQVEAQQ